jgi:hypothetical protein
VVAEAEDAAGDAEDADDGAPGDVHHEAPAAALPRVDLEVAEGESVIKYKSPQNVLKDTYDYSYCLARSYE